MTSQLVLPLESQSAMARADFIESPANQRALAFLDLWPDWPGPAAALFGPAASGKTHLAHIWALRAGAVLLDAWDLREPVAGAAVIENMDGAGTHDAALFAMLERGSPFCLLAAPIRAWLVGIVARPGVPISCAGGFELGEPDEALLMALAVKLFADRQVLVPEAVVTRLVQQLERSPAAIRDFIARADQEALRLQKPINLQLIRGLMAD